VVWQARITVVVTVLPSVSVAFPADTVACCQVVPSSLEYSSDADQSTG
jgi:hypothetical protein